MPCFIVAADERDEGAARAARLAGGLGYDVSTTADLEALRAVPAFRQAARPMVLLLPGAGGGGMAEAAVRFASAERGHAFLLYVADQIAPEAYKRLLRTQAAEWSSWESLPRELGEAAQQLSGVEPVGRGARIVGFLPSKGGVGNTLLAAETGVHLAAARKGAGRVAILDLDFQGGTLADSLDIEARFDVAELTGRPDRLDGQLVDVLTSRFSDGLDIFASPPRQGEPEGLEPETIFAVLDLIASRYDLVLLDIPHRRLPWTDNLLLGSDAVVVTGGGGVPALKQLRARLAQVDALGLDPARVLVAVNACESGLFGAVARRAEIAAALHGRQPSFVRRDDAVGEALNAGRPLLELAPRSRAAADIRRLAGALESALGSAPAAARGKRR